MINDSRPRLDTHRKSEFTTVEQETDAREEAVAAQLAQWAKHLPALLAKFPWTLPRTLLGFQTLVALAVSVIRSRCYGHMGDCSSFFSMPRVARPIAK